MKREIKFRGKSVISGEWKYGHLNLTESGRYTIRYGGNDWIVDPDTICQCSGLIDGDGQEIYEDDIVAYEEDGRLRAPLRCVFEYGAFGYWYYQEFHAWAGNTNFSFNPLGKDRSFKVVGNIFDNSDMLDLINLCAKHEKRN